MSIETIAGKGKVTSGESKGVISLKDSRDYLFIPFLSAFIIIVPIGSEEKRHEMEFLCDKPLILRFRNPSVS